MGESNSYEAFTKCYKTLKDLTPSEPTAWWRIGRKRLKKDYWLKEEGQ